MSRRAIDRRANNKTIEQTDTMETKKITVKLAEMNKVKANLMRKINDSSHSDACRKIYYTWFLSFNTRLT